MATTWTIAGQLDTCGRCGEPLEPGLPMLAIHPPGLQRRLLRCEACGVAIGYPLDMAAIQRAMAAADEAIERRAIADEPRAPIVAPRSNRAVRQVSPSAYAEWELFDVKAKAARSSE